MTLEGLNTEGVLIFANITKCKAYYSDKEFDYNYPEGLSELVQQGIVHIITTDEAVEVVNFAFDTDEIDLDMCCLLYTSPSPRDLSTSRMPSSA